MPDLIDLVFRHGTLLVFTATLAARIGAPVPAAPVLAVAGAAAMVAQASLVELLAVAIVANLLGDGLWFWAGRRYGYQVLKLLCRISMSPDSCVRQSEAFIGRWGGSSLLAAKFVPGVSVVAPPMAGALGMSILTFIGYESLAALIWAGALLGLGAAFSGQIRDVLALMSTLGIYALAVLTLALAAYVVFRFLRRRAFLRAVGMARISVPELRELMDGSSAQPVVIDVRSDVGRSLDARRIPGALGWELGALKSRYGELPQDREIVLYCNCPNEATAAVAAQLLASHGFLRVRPLAGGLEAWLAAGHAFDEHPGVVEQTGEPAPVASA
ncbi:MAG TPA: rhodanese-like domain-containing protein [Burkholderiaceae bacterium]|nr:rhodanese-like domain-containing protein [Burkholderiaceae bacterium]